MGFFVIGDGNLIFLPDGLLDALGVGDALRGGGVPRGRGVGVLEWVVRQQQRSNHSLLSSWCRGWFGWTIFITVVTNIRVINIEVIIGRLKKGKHSWAL